jgi:copper chaperone CopZ
MKNLLLILLATFLTTASFAQQTETAPAKTPACCAAKKDGKACAGEMKEGKACAAGEKTGMIKKEGTSADEAVVAGLEKVQFKVNGNCGMCKMKIEKGAKTGGATSADWDPDTHQMVLVYDPKKANLDDIHKAIAATGYDTDKVKADDATYKKLHGCCQYDRSSL